MQCIDEQEGECTSHWAILTTTSAPPLTEVLFIDNSQRQVAGAVEHSSSYQLLGVHDGYHCIPRTQGEGENVVIMCLTELPLLVLCSVHNVVCLCPFHAFGILCL